MQLYVISPVWHLYATYINFNIFTVASYFPVKRNYLLTLYAMSLVKYICTLIWTTTTYCKLNVLAMTV